MDGDGNAITKPPQHLRVFMTGIEKLALMMLMFIAIKMRFQDLLWSRCHATNLTGCRTEPRVVGWVSVFRSGILFVVAIDKNIESRVFVCCEVEADGV